MYYLTLWGMSVGCKVGFEVPLRQEGHRFPRVDVRVYFLLKHLIVEGPLREVSNDGMTINRPAYTLSRRLLR